MSSSHPPLISLLEAISSDREDLALDKFEAITVAWAIRNGLGPLLYRAVRRNPQSVASSHWSSLKSADLTARVVIGEHFQALREIGDACRSDLPPLTLLKGISISEQCYPEPHLRLMRDIDFLVAKESLSAVTTALHQLGYRQLSKGGLRYEKHHHLEPFFHQDKQVWVEVHHGLFSTERRAGSAKIFSRENLAAQTRPSRFQGIEVRRLSFELQLVYLASHWAQDFARVGGLVALVDTIYLLRQAGADFSWEWLLRAVNSSVPATYLYLLLSYIVRYDLVKVAPEIMRELAFSQPSFGCLSLKTMHRMIDDYLVKATEFGPLLSERSVGIIWNTLMLPGPTLSKFALIPVNLSLPRYCRIQ
ncbi:MAG TPA: nucleotidyltransferase family protein [Candidatus Binatia bacterium]